MSTLTQTTMFDTPIKVHAPHNSSETSRLGAEAIASAVPAQCRQVLNYVRSRPDGATNSEIANATGLPLHCVCGRRNELVRIGALVVSGKRKAPSGVLNAVVKVK